MAFRILRQIGTLELGSLGAWQVKALVQAGSKKAWVLATGPTHEAAQARLHELVNAQVATWEASSRE